MGKYSGRGMSSDPCLKTKSVFSKAAGRCQTGMSGFLQIQAYLSGTVLSFHVLKGIPENTQICYIYEDTDNKSVMIGTEKGLFILRNNDIELLTEFND